MYDYLSFQFKWIEGICLISLGYTYIYAYDYQDTSDYNPGRLYEMLKN